MLECMAQYILQVKATDRKEIKLGCTTVATSSFTPFVKNCCFVSYITTVIVLRFIFQYYICKISLLDGLQQHNLLTTVIHPLMFTYLLKLFCSYLALSMSTIVCISNHPASFVDTMWTYSPSVGQEETGSGMFDSLSFLVWCMSIWAWTSSSSTMLPLLSQ